MSGDKDEVPGPDLDAEQGINEEFLGRFYANQFEQRWRGSRNQDWTVLGIITSMTVAILVLHTNLMPSGDLLTSILMLALPIIMVVFAKIGLNILWLHQGVMDHAVFIARGIERYFGIREKGKDTKADQADDFFVGEIVEGNKKYFTYPSKASYLKKEGRDYKKFSIKIRKRENVQAVMGFVYYLIIWIAALLLIADIWQIFQTSFPGST